VYSTHRDAFSEEHRRIVEVIARQVSETVQNTVNLRRDERHLHDRMSDLPNRQYLERLIASELTRVLTGSCSILLVEIDTAASAPAVRNTATALVLAVVRGALRRPDVVFRDEGERFILLLPQTDAIEADTLGRRIGSELSVGGGADELRGVVASVRISRATAPDDGNTLVDLLRSAEHRPVWKTFPPRPSIH
jgi:GGDEF domain-containing protein